MALIHCSGCGKESLNVEAKCQFCGKPLKLSIWKRKLRWNEAYGFILVIFGGFLVVVIKIIGVLILLSGLALIGWGLFTQRVR